MFSFKEEIKEARRIAAEYRAMLGDLIETLKVTNELLREQNELLGARIDDESE